MTCSCVSVLKHPDILRRGPGLLQHRQHPDASDDPRMQTGCLFYKMRSGKHRLGPETRALVEELDVGAQAAYASFLQA